MAELLDADHVRRLQLIGAMRSHAELLRADANCVSRTQSVVDRALADICEALGILLAKVP